MRNIWTIANREYKQYFSTPTAFAIAFIVLLALGLFFYSVMLQAVTQQSAPGVQVVIGPLAVILMLATPAVTTRLLAEEQRLGTLELLLTAPVRDWELVVGKWLGSFLFLLTIVALTWLFPILLNRLVQPGIDQGPLLTGYLAMILLCSALVAIGVMVSSFFSNSMAAFVITEVLFVLLWWILGPVATSVSPSGTGLISYLDFSGHFYNNLFRGVIDLVDVVYFLSITALGLFIATVSVEIRRWR